MSSLRQIKAVVLMNLLTLPQRTTTSLVTIVGVGAAVAVLVTVLGMAHGFRNMISSTGRADRALVFSTAAFSESSSLLPRDSIVALADTPGARVGANGKPLVSPEAVVLVDISTRTDRKRVNVTLRGIQPEGAAVRDELRLVAGRWPRPAVHEIMVGELAAAQFDGLDIDRTINLNDVDWTVVGIFAASGGGTLGSEIIADAETVLAAYRRNQFQSVTVQLDSASAFQTFKDAVAINPLLSVDVWRESDYYAQQSKDFALLLEYIAYGVGGLMGIGAMFGAVNTMYSAVRARSRETATLRALGFRNVSIAMSILSEALLLVMLGSLVGAAVAWLLFDNATTNTLAGSGTQVIYTFDLSFGIIQAGIAGAVLVGLVGAVLPMAAALRAPIPLALQEV